MNSIAIDEEGFPLINEVRLKDEKEGRFLIGNVEKNHEGFFQVSGASLGLSGAIALEPFDTPLIVRFVKAVGDRVEAELPYGLTFPVNLSHLWVDEWDRFRGHNPDGVPFVFSRNAQAQFFDLMEDLTDESFTWQGKEYGVRLKTDLLSHAEKPEIIPEGPHSAIVDMLPRLKLPKCRILSVIAKGETDNSQFFAKDGHITHSLVLQGEIPKRKSDKEEYDFIFVSREVLRFYSGNLKEFFKGIKSLMPAQGNLFVVADVGQLYHQGTFWVPELTEWEVREALRKDFDFLFWGRWKKSIEPWDKKELFLYAQKKRVV